MGEMADWYLDQALNYECEYCGAVAYEPHAEDCEWNEKEKPDDT